MVFFSPTNRSTSISPACPKTRCPSWTALERNTEYVNSCSSYLPMTMRCATVTPSQRRRRGSYVCSASRGSGRPWGGAVYDLYLLPCKESSVARYGEKYLFEGRKTTLFQKKILLLKELYSDWTVEENYQIYWFSVFFRSNCCRIENSILFCCILKHDISL